MAAVGHEAAEEIRVKICAYVKEHRDVVREDLMRDLGITVNQCVHHLRELTHRGHLVKMIRSGAAKRVAVYNLGKRPYAPKVKEVKEKEVKPEPKSDLHEKAKAVCTVHRLLDRKVEPNQKRELRKTHAGSMQSGMAMFGNW